MYADDTTLYCHGKDTTTVQESLQSALNDASEWLKANRLVVNADKSNFVVAGSKRRLIDFDINIMLDSTVINRCNSTKMLGVVIDEHISWKNHVEYLLSKVAPKLSLLYRLSFVLSRQSLSTLYISIIQSHIDYCLSVWGNCNATQLSAVQKIQNRAARIICRNFEYATCSIALIRELGWQTVQERYNYFTAILVFKCLNGQLSGALCDNFTMVNGIHDHNTRASASQNLHVPKPYTNYMKRSLSYCGVAQWNCLPNHVRNSESLSGFKRSYKKWQQSNILT